MAKSKYTEDDFKNYCDEKELIYVGYDREKKLGSVVSFICRKHKDKGIQKIDWSHLKTYAHGCVYCSGRKQTTEEIYTKIKHKNIKLISEYKGNEKPIKCECLDCGNVWTTKPKVLITNGSGCPKCGRKKANANEMKSHSEFIEQLRNVNDTIEVIGIYNGFRNTVQCKCKNCGKEWLGRPVNLLRLEAGCPFCNASTGEQKLLKCLDEFRIHYTPQYPISVIGRNRPLRFDAFDEQNNVAFEYDGEQHYFPVSFGGLESNYIERFQYGKQRDTEKNVYCERNNITIVRIPYWERDNIKEYLLKEFIKKGIYLEIIKAV